MNRGTFGTGNIKRIVCCAFAYCSRKTKGGVRVLEKDRFVEESCCQSAPDTVSYDTLDNASFCFEDRPMEGIVRR
jgi:hypothetical protein